MKKEVLQILIAKYLNGEATDEEQAILFSIYEQYQKQELDWQPENMGDREQVKQSVLSKIQHRINAEPIVVKPLKRPVYYRIAAAIVLLCLSVGGYIYLNDSRNVAPQQLSAQNNVLPGSDKAVLTLANGRKINLNNNEHDLLLINEPGVVITRDTNGTIIYTASKEEAAPLTGDKDAGYNTVETPRGGRYLINLPDGSKVWLNAASSIRFPLRFANNKRRITLTGEGYFEVAKDKRRPFIVHTATQQVEVLGTHFNLNAYTDESAVKTTLLEGSVRVNKLDGINNVNPENAKILVPGEQAVLSGSLIKLKKVDTEQAVAWKNGIFYFSATPLKEMMAQLSRWYDVDIVYSGDVKNELFYGKIDRSYSLYDVLNVLQVGNVHFKIETDENGGKKKLIVIP